MKNVDKNNYQQIIILDILLKNVDQNNYLLIIKKYF